MRENCFSINSNYIVLNIAGALGQTDLGENADDLYQPMGEMTDLPPQTDLALMAQDPGDGGSDDDGSDEDEELDDEDEMSDEEEESDGENEMVVLDPDHVGTE